MAKKQHEPWNTEKKNKVLKGPIVFTGRNKVPIVGKYRVGKSPPTEQNDTGTTQLHYVARIT